jgi:hypothetical protein
MFHFALNYTNDFFLYTNDFFLLTAVHVMIDMDLGFSYRCFIMYIYDLFFLLLFTAVYHCLPLFMNFLQFSTYSLGL